MSDLPPDPPAEATAPAEPPQDAAPEPRPEDFERPPYQKPVDPYAHRRGEPRLFAVLWTFYVLFAVAGSVTWVARSAAVTVGSYSPAARIMLVVVAAGATVLWPMTRLSQASPRSHALAAAAGDVIVVLGPTQLVVWPLIVLAGWPIGTVGAVSLLFLAWIMLIGAVLGLANSGRPIRQVGHPGLAWRSVWMVVCLALVGLAPICVGSLGPRGAAPDWLRALSPFTAIPAITGRGVTGPMAPIVPSQWLAMGLTLALGIALWGAAIIRSRAGRLGSAGLD